MSKKPLGLDKDGVQKVMLTGDYFADSLGQFSLNAISGLVGQLTYFYTDKVGMAAGAVATVFFICKIWCCNVVNFFITYNIINII